MRGGGTGELKRAKQNRKEKEYGARELPHLDAKLRGGEIVDGEQWNGDAAGSSKLQQWRRARKLGLCESSGCGFGFRVPGARGAAFIDRDWVLGVRAKIGAATRAAGSDSSSSPARSGEGDCLCQT